MRMTNSVAVPQEEGDEKRGSPNTLRPYPSPQVEDQKEMDLHTMISLLEEYDDPESDTALHADPTEEERHEEAARLLREVNQDVASLLQEYEASLTTESNHAHAPQEEVNNEAASLLNTKGAHGSALQEERSIWGASKDQVQAHLVKQLQGTGHVSPEGLGGRGFWF